MQELAFLINTTPKYFYLLPLHITLLHRYAPTLGWPIYIATESPELLPLTAQGVNIIHLPMEKEGFLDSRSEAVKQLPPHIKYVLPMQEDFLLEGRPIESAIQSGLDILDKYPHVSSLRLMPCPGPKGSEFMDTPWKILDLNIDSLVFTYQATIWRRDEYTNFMDALIRVIPPGSQNKLAINVNIAEIMRGQEILLSLSEGKGKGKAEGKAQSKIHLAWPREGSHPNAVYLCPWPYRPTAVVRGNLEPWAVDLAKREGFSLEA